MDLFVWWLNAAKLKVQGYDKLIHNPTYTLRYVNNEKDRAKQSLRDYWLYKLVSLDSPDCFFTTYLSFFSKKQKCFHLNFSFCNCIINVMFYFPNTDRYICYVVYRKLIFSLFPPDCINRFEWGFDEMFPNKKSFWTSGIRL